jgi:hypothetical protein
VSLAGTLDPPYNTRYFNCFGLLVRRVRAVNMMMSVPRARRRSGCEAEGEP